MSTRGVRRYVADLLRGRRPRRFDPTAEEAAELRAAITLRAAGPDADGPSEQFVEMLHQRLETAQPQRDPQTRRTVVRVASIAAASAAIGVAADRALAGSRSAEHPAAQSLNPTAGEWRTVAASAELAEGRVLPFDLGTVTGFVQRSNGAPRAVSGSCTHLGCRLALEASTRKLNCPCHKTAFASTGEVLYHELPAEPPPLPAIQVRDTGDVIQVYVPR